MFEELTQGFAVDPVYRADALLADMDATGVDEAVVVGYPICEWTDNWYTVQCVEEHDRLTGIVMVDQFADDAAETLRDLMAIDGILGFRLGVICPYHRMWETFDYDVTWLRDAIQEAAFWEVAQETDAVVQLMAHTSQFDQVRELMDRYPDLPYLLDHWAHVDARAPPEEAMAPFAELADYNVAVKLSEVAHTSSEGYPYEDVHPHVQWLLDTFGREGVIWGSDFPNVSHPDFGDNTYEETLSWLDHVDEFSTADRKWLTDRAFRRFVGL